MSQRVDVVEKHCLLNGDEESDDSVDSEIQQQRPNPRLYLTLILLILLVLSLSLNISLVLTSTPHPPKDSHKASDDDSRLNSRYANMPEKELEIAWQLAPENFSSHNHTITDALWPAISYDAGTVAIDMEWAKKKGLPETSRYPWDQSKGIYLINGFHNLHCVTRLYISMMEYRDGLPQSLPFDHLVHCLDSLRQDILCAADDTPRWTKYRAEQRNSHYTGNGQNRQCRDWSKLEAWAKENTACYRYGDPSWNQRSQFERFKFCPNDSPFLPKIREFFGKGEDWMPGNLDY